MSLSPPTARYITKPYSGFAEYLPARLQLDETQAGSSLYLEIDVDVSGAILDDPNLFGFYQNSFSVRYHAPLYVTGGDNSLVEETPSQNIFDAGNSYYDTYYPAALPALPDPNNFFDTNNLRFFGIPPAGKKIRSYAYDKTQLMDAQSTGTGAQAVLPKITDNFYERFIDDYYYIRSQNGVHVDFKAVDDNFLYDILSLPGIIEQMRYRFMFVDEFGVVIPLGDQPFLVQELVEIFAPPLYKLPDSDRSQLRWSDPKQIAEVEFGTVLTTVPIKKILPLYLYDNESFIDVPCDLPGISGFVRYRVKTTIT